MAADHFCLRWNNYQSNMVTELDTLRSEEHLVDVTLSCEGQKFRAHKVILSACSVYFRNVFKENPCEHPVVILKDVSHEDVEALLSFVYQGVVYVSEKKLASFLQTAELLQIKGLTGAASSIKENHNTDKGGPPPLNPTWPSNKSSAKSSCSPTPPKRKKGTPVRICKTSDGGGGGDTSDTNSNNAVGEEEGEIAVKQERMEEGETLSVQVSLGADDDTSHDGSSMMMAMYHDVGGGGDSNSASVGGGEGEEDCGGEEEEDDGEVKGAGGEMSDTTATLLERSLSGASVSRQQFDMQGPFSAFPIPAPGQGLPDQLTPSGGASSQSSSTSSSSHLAQCGNCPHCGKPYTNQSALKYHVRLMHSDLTNRQCCYLCPLSFAQREHYKSHMLEKHNVRC
ncbi:protein tramtrack, beta isoform isoform X2 [Nilaparvata lugens]|uniref:protein tramtrack, beta isoform isoform X2 n=1 Tax=Nilaparvata lugens TaxID=108931 RepID=UPI00193C98B8|nr:protein tramtrack, beta isoform isoform X2 [Nilaparvata lugens]